MAQQMNQYEAMFLLGPIGTAEPENALKICRGIIERHGGQIMVIKKWDERKLSYEIRGQKRGTYVVAFFKAPGAALSAIERDVTLSEEVLRVIVLKADHLNQDEMAAVEPQPIAPPREDRPIWERDTRDRGPDISGNENRPPRRPRRDEAEIGAPE
jgi:small subunit ribosomal protein S6